MSFPRLLAIICFVLSQGTILVSYLVSLQFDHPKVESCNPFINGCLNITDAGIYSPDGYIFRGGMITACGFFIMWWLSNFYINKQLIGQNSRLLQSSTALGVIGAICLIIATALLIPPRSAINWDLHVAGAIFFFLITFAAQLIDTIFCIKNSNQLTIPPRSLLVKKWVVVIQGIMIATFLLMEFLGTGDRLVNAIEWWLALLIAVYFLTTAWDWKNIEFNLNAKP
jgi:hypothetical protein